MKNVKIIKSVVIFSAVLLFLVFIGYIVYFFASFYAFGAFDKYYSTDELIANFKEKQQPIYELKRYFNKIVPHYKSVDIEFKSDDELDRLTITPVDTGRGSDLTVQFQDWNLKIGSKKVDSLLKVLGWTNISLKQLKEKLDNANCISIQNGDPAKIGFKRAGMGMYFFNVFDKPIPDSLKARYNDSCTYVYANKKLVLEFGGGAIGSQCFFNKTTNDVNQ